MAYEPHNWTCPFCNRDQVVTQEQFDTDVYSLGLKKNRYGLVGYTLQARACANPECGEVELKFWFGPGTLQHSQYGPTRFVHDDSKEFQRLRPRTNAKHQPDCVPPVLAEDYYEACAVRDLSPKASATLSRRVLQGMIRDFCGIREDTLFKEIVALEKLSAEGNAPRGVAHETIAAMHHVRSVGNIGAHMHDDINVIVDVDIGEAQALIDLIELMFRDWYVARDHRQAQLRQLKAIADAKGQLKAAVRSTASAPDRLKGGAA